MRESRTRFPRTLEEAFPKDYRGQYDPMRQPPKDRTPADYWVAVAAAYALGFVTAMLIQW